MTVSFRRAMLVALLAPSLASAQPPPGRGQGQGQPLQGQPPAGQGQRPGQATAAFTAAEQARITAWLAANAASLRPLPPGVARNVARGKPLPPGIAKRAAPQPLLAQLIHRPGYEVLVVGTAVVLAQAGNLLVHDIVQSALR
jgi:hypothetical protein